jgi:hypothetical protein
VVRDSGKRFSGNPTGWDLDEPFGQLQNDRPILSRHFEGSQPFQSLRIVGTQSQQFTIESRRSIPITKLDEPECAVLKVIGTKSPASAAEVELGTADLADSGQRSGGNKCGFFVARLPIESSERFA